MRLLRQFIAVFFALGFACSGAVGLNPSLHFLIEHGGRGRIHSHFGVAAGRTESIWHDDGDGYLHQHVLQLKGGETVPFDHVDKFYLPKIPVGKALLFFGQLFQNQSPLRNGSSNHQHHSLPEMLLGGALEAHFQLAFVFIPTPVPVVQPLFAFTPISRELDRQSLGRGPPTFPS